MTKQSKNQELQDKLIEKLAQNLANRERENNLTRNLNKIVMVDDVYYTPIGLAVDMALATHKDAFLSLHTEAKIKNVPFLTIYKEKMANRESPTSILRSTKLIGGNGIGKTETVIPKICAWLRENGLNPVVHQEYVGKDNDVSLPTSQCPEKDVLVLYISCVGLEATEIRGIPLKEEEQRVILNDEFKPSGETKTVSTIKYSEVKKWANMKNFAQVILILDEINRSPELSLFNALLNGEPVEGLQTAPVTLIFSMMNSEMDGLNHVNSSDGAAKTKTQTFHVYQTVEEWSRWALANNVHPAVIGFLNANAKFFEVQKDNGKEVAYPTFRGATKFSQDLMNVEQSFPHVALKTSKMLGSLFQSRVGVHADCVDLPTNFCSYYNNIHTYVVDQLEKALNANYNPLHFGFSDERLNKDIKNVEKNIMKMIEQQQSGIEEEEKFEAEDYEKPNGDLIAKWVYSIPNYITTYINNSFSSNRYNFVNYAIAKLLQDNYKNLEESMTKAKLTKLFIANESFNAKVERIVNDVELYHFGFALLQENIKEVSKNLKAKNYKELIVGLNANYLVKAVSELLHKYFAISKVAFYRQADFKMFLEIVKEIKISPVNTIHFELYQQSFEELMALKGCNLMEACFRVARYNFSEPYYGKEDETKLIHMRDFSKDFFEKLFEKIENGDYGMSYDEDLSKSEFTPVIIPSYKDALKNFPQLFSKETTDEQYKDIVEMVCLYNNIPLLEDQKLGESSSRQDIRKNKSK